jgi:hypothetical protein
MQLLACSDCGFESRLEYGCLSLVIVVCFQVQISATSRSLVQICPAECGVSECESDASKIRTPWPNGAPCAMEKNIYDLRISH